MLDNADFVKMFNDIKSIILSDKYLSKNNEIEIYEYKNIYFIIGRNYEKLIFGSKKVGYLNRPYFKIINNDGILHFFEGASPKDLEEVRKIFIRLKLVG